MLRCLHVRRSQMSPYAAALKHVALRGAPAFGPTAKESDIALYRAASELPADYRPPVQGQWDDTVERWAYAWQSPIADLAVRSSEKIRHHSEFHRLVEVAKKLIAASDPKLESSAQPVPGSPDEQQMNSSDTQVDSTGGVPSSRAATTLPTGASSPSSEPNRTKKRTLKRKGAKRQVASGDASDVSGDAGTLTVTTSESPPNAATTGGSAKLMSAEEFSRQTAVPIPYIDDGSPMAQLSKEFGLMLIETFDVPYDATGIRSSIAALSKEGHFDEAKGVLAFALKMQFDVSADHYNALMSGYSKLGDHEAVMNVIETMKERALTPTTVTWNTLARCFIRRGDGASALQVLENAKALANCEPTEEYFLSYFDALAVDRSRLSGPFEALQTFDQMEHVNGIIPTKPLYHSFMRCLQIGDGGNSAELRQKVEECAQKMAMLGMTWDQQTFTLLLQNAARQGDLSRLRELFCQMRHEGVACQPTHMAVAIQAHTSAMKKLTGNAQSNDASRPVQKLVEYVNVGFGLLEMLYQRGGRASVTPRVLDSLMELVSCAYSRSLEPGFRETASSSPSQPTEEKGSETEASDPSITSDSSNNEHSLSLASHVDKLWKLTYDELGLTRTTQSYHHYIVFLARQLRIDEAESIFQELTRTYEARPLRKTYEALILMHLLSGEEGGSKRAINYMEAMQRDGHSIRPQLLFKMRKSADDASYRRDMKRRARRIMQAREEYLARQQMTKDDAGLAAAEVRQAEAAAQAQGQTQLAPLPISATSTLAWWHEWKAKTVSKHELFETERDDGLPRGESFSEKNAALAKMGITSQYLTPQDVPTANRDPKTSITAAIARESEFHPAGALWAIDGGEINYPATRAGSEGWAATLWREGRIVRKMATAQQSSDAAAAAKLSSAGNAIRTAPEQLLIEQANAKTVGELRDAQMFPDHVYDDGTPKSAKELAAPISPAAELVWQVEAHDALSPYRTNEELEALAAPGSSTNRFRGELADDVKAKADAAIQALKSGTENEVSIVGRGVTRKAKYDYLEKWRDLYRQGTLDLPEQPVIRFGRTPTDHRTTIANSIKSWFEQNRRQQPTEDEQQLWRSTADRNRDMQRAKQHMRRANGSKDSRQRTERAHRDPSSHPEEGDE